MTENINTYRTPSESITAPTAELVLLRQREHVLFQQNALVSDQDVRGLLNDVSFQRFGRQAEEYDDFTSLQAAMRQTFDFRSRADGSYAERADAEEFECDGEMAQRIYLAAEKFGLTGSTEPEYPYAKLALVLGGAGKSPLDRTTYTKELIDSGKLVVDMVAMLGSDRSVDEPERIRAGDYAGNASSEFELMIAAAEVVFGAQLQPDDIYELTDPSIADNLPRHARIANIQATEQHPTIFILSAPMLTDPFEVRNGTPGTRNRTNTRDTYNMLSKVADFVPGDRAVAITNAHFTPFQGADAAGQLAGFGVETEVVGFDPTHFGNPAKKPNELLQEMLTAADSLAKAT